MNLIRPCEPHDRITPAVVHQHTPGENHDHDHDSAHRHVADEAIDRSGAGNEETAAPRVDARPLVIALAITLIFLVVEVVGAYLSNSLALLADAAHMLTDVAALGLALLAIALARRPATAERSFGFLRAEILAALVNAVTLIVAAIYIFYEAWERLQDPPEVQSDTLLVVAIAGLCANIASALVLSRGGGHEHNLNQRGAFLHVLGDLLGSVATIAAALIIKATGWYAADPILSAVIGLLVVYGAWSLLRESVDVLLEAAPRGMNVAQVRRAMQDVPGVLAVHDLHVWTVTSGLVALSAHVEIASMQNWSNIMGQLATTLRDDFDIAHVTLQPELAGSPKAAWDRCSLDAPAAVTTCATTAPARPRLAHAGHRH
ncbi:MAG: cation transporter [Chloroflexia bacterium]|nr:cation transporter [Chloroflexia bacterium]